LYISHLSPDDGLSGSKHVVSEIITFFGTTEPPSLFYCIGKCFFGPEVVWQLCTDCRIFLEPAWDVRTIVCCKVGRTVENMAYSMFVLHNLGYTSETLSSKEPNISSCGSGQAEFKWSSRTVQNFRLANKQILQFISKLSIYLWAIFSLVEGNTKISDANFLKIWDFVASTTLALVVYQLQRTLLQCR
jgi:hypothetical protein